MEFSIDFQNKLEEFIASALREDMGDGDHSTQACIDANAKGKAILKIKDKGILAGVDIAEKIFLFLEPNAIIKKYKKDDILKLNYRNIGDARASKDKTNFIIVSPLFKKLERILPSQREKEQYKEFRVETTNG